VKWITGKAVFHPTIQTMGFQTVFSVNHRSKRKPLVKRAALAEGKAGNDLPLGSTAL
jgi:hypothetical protein